jgi:hypothetical protein
MPDVVKAFVIKVRHCFLLNYCDPPNRFSQQKSKTAWLSFSTLPPILCQYLSKFNIDYETNLCLSTNENKKNTFIVFKLNYRLTVCSYFVVSDICI